jgi:hypothetical protein
MSGYAIGRMADAGMGGHGETTGMNVPTMSMPATTTFAPLRLGVHILVAVSIGIISPFTGLAWPFALLVGMSLGSEDARRLRGEPHEPADAAFLRAIGVAGGILAMLFFGAFVGGLVAIVVVALTSFSERAAAHASPTDRGVARILLFIVPVAMWLILFPLLGVNVDVRIGS